MHSDAQAASLRHSELDRRILAVLKRGTAAGLEEWQLELLRLLAVRKGREHAISIAHIQRILPRPKDHTGDWQPPSEREIKAAVSELILRFQIPVGSLRGKGHGYFLIVDAEDHALALKSLKRQIKSEAQRVRALSGPRFLAELFGQIRAELDAETNPPQRHRDTEAA